MSNSRNDAVWKATVQLMRCVAGCLQVYARHVHDPTNALQLRLREAEREVFRVKLQQVGREIGESDANNLTYVYLMMRLSIKCGV